MDKSKFTSDAPGRLVPVSTPEKNWAFIPDSLPPRWKAPIDLWPLIVEARQQVARLDGIGKTLPDIQLLLSPLQSREALSSSSIEGTYATPEELLLFEMQGRVSGEGMHDRREVSNYGQALRRGVEQLARKDPFSLRMIRGLHRVLMTGTRGRHHSPGEFRRHQVHIGADTRFIPPPANFVPDILSALERHINQADSTVDPLVRCYIIHYQFEAIHPFADGNGRVGRLLLAMMTYKWLELSHPWLYMSAYFERTKDDYISRLFNVSATAAWTDWIEYCLKGTVEQATDSIRRCDLLRKLKDRFLSVAGTGSPRTHVIIGELFSIPILTISGVAELLDVSYPTAKADVDKLVAARVLKEMPDTRNPKFYYAPKIFKIAYRDE